MPSSVCSSRPISGTRDEPPTSSTPLRSCGVMPDERITPSVCIAALCSIGRTACSSSSRVTCSDRSDPGTGTGAIELRESISFAPRTSTQNSQRSRRSRPLAGRCSRAQSSGAVRASWVPRWSTRAASMSRPPRSSRPPEPITWNALFSCRTTATSSVPAPRSKTTSARPGGTRLRSTPMKYWAAATGSGTSDTSGQPAAAAASRNSQRRRWPHEAG
ncbi:MAG: hypothetical protein AUG44_19975 [Actinobacteria bacterium 13_1_20CM_3_71_11]|nr:MAG: hypothetical protein AUG44_19975 [Actinobacteria bacterium 13_1_20CM_3_71_11]